MKIEEARSAYKLEVMVSILISCLPLINKIIAVRFKYYQELIPSKKNCIKIVADLLEKLGLVSRMALLEIIEDRHKRKPIIIVSQMTV
ncbi:hypothetical protein [Spirochaeta cellobiosiphila]|uniref:hypothetical protein n=1 Tax=Spirochaeta cellobiosiphila TaxID=504483 RepID=UPI00048DCF58|nr:hypothetical protein [Spirochaeta cellobiosiphila]